MKASKKLSKIKGAKFYKVGDKVEAVRTRIGAWFDAEIIDIIREDNCLCDEECRCTYKLLFEGEENENVEVEDKKINEIREISYSSIAWEKLKAGMKVVINYNVDKPKQWGYWYDYIIEDIQKRKDVYYLSGTLCVGFEGSLKKIPVVIDSDNVADVLAVRPPMTIQEKERDDYETGVKPDYCKKCRNKPKVKCRTCCCCKCGNKKDFELTVQCDECSDWYHIYCITPPLPELPDDDDDWYCPKCNNETHRAKLEMKQKKVKQNQRAIKKKKSKAKTTVEKVLKTPPKSSKEVDGASKIQDVLPEKGEEANSEMKEISKKSKIWEQIRQLFPGYDVIRVTAEVTRKNPKDLIISDAAKKLIANDVINEHLWEEAMKSSSLGKEAFLSTVKRIFTCAICCELLNDPITLSCKHSFCIDCFFRSLSVNIYNCCLCRIDVIHTKHYTINDNLRDALNILFRKNVSD